jgi:hypothetical protein
MAAKARQTTLEAELLEFRDGPGPLIPCRTPHRFSVTISGDFDTAVATVDDALEAVAGQFGQGAGQIANVRLTLRLESLDGPRGQQTLPVEVRRDAEGDTFTAAAPDFGAWGHGATVGEAVLDFLTDLTDRSEILLAHRDALGPSLRRQAEALERWAASIV